MKTRGKGSLLDRFLTLWIFLAMGAGYYFPVIDPLVEVPALTGLVNVALFFRQRYPALFR